MYVAQARFPIDRAPGAIDLSHYVTLPFLEKIDPAIKHVSIAAADPTQSKAEQTAGNDNPDRKWCTGRATSVCIQSTYQLEGKIPMGIMLVNKLRDSARKVADHIDFQSEFSAPAPADLDQDGLRQLTALDLSLIHIYAAAGGEDAFRSGAGSGRSRAAPAQRLRTHEAGLRHRIHQCR